VYALVYILEYSANVTVDCKALVAL